MAHHLSAKKRIRQTAKRHQRNMFYKTRMRTFIKRAREVAASTDPQEREAALRLAMSMIDRAASRGAIHRNTAARKISRLAALHRKSSR